MCAELLVASHANRQSDASLLLVRDRHGAHGVPLAEVAALYADHKYTRFCFEGREFLVRDSLKALAGRLPASPFVQVRRGLLINRAHVQRLCRRGKRLVLQLRDGSAVVVSRRQRQPVCAALGCA